MSKYSKILLINVSKPTLIKGLKKNFKFNETYCIPMVCPVYPQLHHKTDDEVLLS